MIRIAVMTRTLVITTKQIGVLLQVATMLVIMGLEMKETQCVLQHTNIAQVRGTQTETETETETETPSDTETETETETNLTPSKLKLRQRLRRKQQHLQNSN